jgi:uncharacterized protein YukE
MFTPPNSSAMDATAGSGGPSTILPQIITGNQPAIASHASSLLSTATTLTSMVSEFTSAAQSLSNVWSGQASETALKKISDSLSAFTKIIQVIQNGAKLLQASGALVQTAQTGYTSVVSATNPTVASLMSNPWTYSAAVALSTGTSAALRGFTTGVQGMLTGTSAMQLLQEIAALAQIASTIEQLISGSGAAPTATTVPTIPTTPPITTPTTIPTIASATGQQAAQGIGVGQSAIPSQYLTSTTPTTNPNGSLAGAGLDGNNGYGIPGATSSIPGTTTGATPTNLGLTGTTPTTGYIGTPNSSTTGLTPSINPSDSWIAVDPSQQAAAAGAATAPAAPTAPAANPQDVSVTTTDNGITTTVQVPAGQAANIQLDMTVNNDHVSENLNIGADGSVSVS